MLRGIAAFSRFPVISSNSRICRNTMSGIPGPVSPKFVSLEDGQGFRFRVISYNILAQVYVKSSYFPHSPSSCLRWKARSQAILTDLKNLNADFFCIQELDEYDVFYKSNMEKLGYSSIYVQRNGQKRDGCGIFYKLNSADLVLKEEIDYNDLVKSIDNQSVSTDLENNSNQVVETSRVTLTEDLLKKKDHGDHGVPNDPRVRLKRDCVGVLAAFRLKNPSQDVVVLANTHIYWDPGWIDVKLAQVKYLLHRLEQFKEVVSNKYSCSPSILLAGDFNSTPGDEVYQYLVSADLSVSSAAPYKLCSLYGTNGGEPAFTNCTPGFTGTLDYIFLSSIGYLKPITLLELPGPQSPDIIGGLPNHHHPSDHLPIGGDFEVLQSLESASIPKLHEVEDDFVKLKLEDQIKD